MGVRLHFTYENAIITVILSVLQDRCFKRLTPLKPLTKLNFIRK